MGDNIVQCFELLGVLKVLYSHIAHLQYDAIIRECNVTCAGGTQKVKKRGT